MKRSLFLISLLLIQKSYAQQINTTDTVSGVNPSTKEKINLPPDNQPVSSENENNKIAKTDIEEMPKKEALNNDSKNNSQSIKKNKATTKSTTNVQVKTEPKLKKTEKNLSKTEVIVLPKKEVVTSDVSSSVHSITDNAPVVLKQDEVIVNKPETAQLPNKEIINNDISSTISPSTKAKINSPADSIPAVLKKDEKTIVKQDIEQVAKNAVFTNNSDIYEVTINENWSFSGLIKIESQKLFIPLKFLPSDLLGNLILTEQNTQIIKNEKNLVLSSTFVKNRDDEKLSLSLNLTEDFFKSQILAVDKNKTLDSHPITAVYTNYSLSMEDSGLKSIRGTFNTVYASKDNWLFKNGMFWDGEKIIRLNSTWQKTYSDYSGLSIGDVTDTSLTGFGSISSLGVKYSTPYFNSSTSMSQILPTIPISGFAVTPSKMDLFLNSQLIQQKEISSGRYSIDVPYQTQGYGVFQAYVYDLNGKPNIVSVPFYSNNEIIKKGANEYSVTAGFIRKDNTTSSTSYDKPYFSGIYKGGITNNWTQDLFVQYSPYYSAVSGLAHIIPHPKIGMLNLGVSRNSLSQSLYKVGLERTGSAFSVGAELQKAQAPTNGFCLGYGQTCIKNQVSAFLGTSLPYKLGGLNMSYVDRSTPNGQNKIASLQWNKQINKYVNIFSSFSSTTSASNGQVPIKNSVLYVGLSVNFDNHFYTNSSYTKDKNGGPSYQQSAYKGENPLHPEYGYGSITVNKTNESQSQNVYYGARLDNFSYQVNSYRDDKGLKTNVSMDGAIAYIPEENYFKFTKSMNGGLVFVNIENLTIPAEISHENRYAGMSDKNGHFLVSDAVSLNNENVSVNINKLPKSITLEENKKQFYIPFSGAVRVDFKSKPLPYIVKIKGVPTGAIFEMNKEFYVIGDKGNVSLETEGNTQIPMDGGGVCDIHITKKQKEYFCVSNKSNVKKEEPKKEDSKDITTSEAKKEEPKKEDSKEVTTPEVKKDEPKKEDSKEVTTPEAKKEDIKLTHLKIINNHIKDNEFKITIPRRKKDSITEKLSAELTAQMNTTDNKEHAFKIFIPKRTKQIV